jgi:hypothetical protein
MGKVFVTKGFDKFAHKSRISDLTLVDRIIQADRGLIDANLVGCLVKLRVARENQGKSGGYRTIVAYRSGDKAFYIYGFSKNETENIDSHEIRTLEQYGSLLMSLSEVELKAALDAQELRQIGNIDANEE